MITPLLTWIRVKLWFATVNRYRGWKAKRQLAEYVKTLSPEQQAWANDLRARLDADPKGSVRILRAESSRLNEKFARLSEQIDQAHRSQA